MFDSGASFALIRLLLMERRHHQTDRYYSSLVPPSRGRCLTVLRRRTLRRQISTCISCKESVASCKISSTTQVKGTIFATDASGAYVDITAKSTVNWWPYKRNASTKLKMWKCADCRVSSQAMTFNASLPCCGKSIPVI
ncbi:hypothetical protein E2542_SST11867 [Spatholobus suberectus]|nr:hypothetical protein E2542_SST11867 [Spatholobus suberectus]